MFFVLFGLPYFSNFSKVKVLRNRTNMSHPHKRKSVVWAVIDTPISKERYFPWPVNQFDVGQRPDNPQANKLYAPAVCGP